MNDKSLDEQLETRMHGLCLAPIEPHCEKCAYMSKTELSDLIHILNVLKPLADHLCGTSVKCLSILSQGMQIC